MDDKFSPTGPSGFPDWGNESLQKDSVGPPPAPSTTIPVSIGFSEDAPEPPKPPKPDPEFNPTDNFIRPPSPPQPPGPPLEAFASAPENSDEDKLGDTEHPIAVTQVYSTYGLEYFIMLISLGVLAFSLAALLNAVIDLSAAKSGGIGSILDPYSEAALVVSLPIFAYLFLRLEAREESHSSFLADSSRRRGIQITLVVSFLFVIGQLISYLGKLFSSGSDYSSLNPWSYNYDSVASSSPWWSDLLHAVTGLVIAGGIFAYFWYKLHKKAGRDL